MKLARSISVLVAVIFCAVTNGFADDAIDAASRLEEAGSFAGAESVLKTRLAQPGVSAGDRKQLAFELDRLERIRLDYPLTREALFKKLQASVRDVTAKEFAQWIDEKHFDVRVIDGKEWFMVSSVANLYWRYPELNPRRISPKDESFQIPLWQTCHDIRLAAQSEKKTHVLPKQFEVTMTVKLDAGVVKPGETVRAWLPVPRRYDYQDGAEILSSSSPVKELAPEMSPIRSAYLEQPAAGNAPTVFKVEYRYGTRGVWFDVDPDKVAAFDGKDADVARFTNEAAHVVFTPAMRELSAQILGGEKNPARQAKKIYEWIGANIKYSFATEYSTIPNISMYCATHHYGDCGQEAMLFITLCRLNGIPARWQSGWDTFPGAEDLHDWTEIYLAPYGWVPVDPFMSIFATRYADKLTPAQRAELRDFYFGGRDQWRMAANADHAQELSPAKLGFRSDNVDFQRGELESGGTNIYFNHYHYALDVKETPVKQ